MHLSSRLLYGALWNVGRRTVQVIYLAHVHPANQSVLLLRALATASQPLSWDGNEGGGLRSFPQGSRLRGDGWKTYKIRLLGHLKSETFSF